MHRQYEEAMNRGQLHDKPAITVTEAMERTINEVEGQTKRLYRTISKHWLNHLGANRKMHHITQEDIDTYVAKRQMLGRKPNTIRSEVKVLARATNRLEKRYLVNDDIEWPKIKPTRKTRYLSDREDDMILRRLDHEADEGNVTSIKARDLYVVLLDTGMRLMEAVELPWAYINLRRGEIEVYREKTKSVSLVPISSRVEEVFRRRRKQERPFEKMEWAVVYLRKVINEIANTDPMVIRQKGKATIHTLRDTYATRMILEGNMTLYDLAILLGHSNNAMTEKYAHLESVNLVSRARRVLR
jgi:integrase